MTPRLCGDCASPLSEDQRYCLQCGALAGARRVEPLAALGFAGEDARLPVGGGTTGSASASAGSAALPGAEAPARAARRRPSPRVAAALAASCLVAGGVVGAALGPGPAPSIAAAPPGRVVALVVPQAAPVATTPTTGSNPAPAIHHADAPTPSAAKAKTGTKTTTSSAPSPAGTPTPTKTTSSHEDDDTPASSSTPASTTVPAATVPAHVWLVNAGAPDPTAYAALAAQGALLSGYAAAAPSAAADAVALLGGQVPTADCATDPAPCVLPAGETSLPDQLTSINLTWKAYVEDPAARCGAPDAQVATSLFTTLRDRKDCADTTVGLDALDADLASAGRTPALSLVVPTDPATELTALVAKITASDAYKKDGVLVIVPSVPPPGAIVLSPRATAGVTDATPTGPVALLRSLDTLFGLDPLATAAQQPAGALDTVLKPAAATTPTSPTPSTTTTTTRRSP